MKKMLLILVIIVLAGCSGSFITSDVEWLESHPLVDAAREQIGVVVNYDNGYYQGGYPPEDSGACTDVLDRALRANGYDMKAKIDEDMLNNPAKYPGESDPNINFRRVRNVKIFLDNFEESLSTCTEAECFSEGTWQAGDIVTYDQIPGSLWHIAIVSNKLNSEGVPFLIHNYGRGVVEDDRLLSWPAPITGHYRLSF